MDFSERAEKQIPHLPPRLLGRSSARYHFVCPFLGGAIYANYLDTLFSAYMSRRFLAVGCGLGIYVGATNTESKRSLCYVWVIVSKAALDFRWVLNYKNPTSLAMLTSLGDKVFNRFVIHSDSSLVSYSLDILSRLALGQTQTQTLDASIEQITGNDINVAFSKHVHVGGRALR